MSSDKSSSVTGFALIGIILLAFTWYNTKQYEKQVEANRAAMDSLALVSVPSDSSVNGVTGDAELTGEDSVTFRNEALEAAYNAETAYYTIENDKVAVTVSSLGAQPYDVLVKDYFTFDSSDLHLVRPECSSLNFELNTQTQWVNTKDLNFALVENSAGKLVLRLSFDENSHIDAIYSLAPESYMVDFTLDFVGMDRILERRTTQLAMQWQADMPRLEKGYKNEKNYSAVAYRYAGETSEVRTLGQRKDSAFEEFTSRIGWIGFQQQFFSAIVLADNDFSGGKLTNRFYPESDPDRRLMQSEADMTIDVDARQSEYTIPLHFYFGPNHFPTLKGYGKQFEKIIPLGGKVIGSISRFVIIPTFNWLSKSIASYGLIILILTLMIKLVVTPLSLKSYISSAKMKVLKPEIDKIAAKYPKQEDALKKQQATMELYRKAGVSTMGGCLPILLQFPILWAMFRFFPASIELRQQPFLWADDLSAYDSILDFGFNVPLFGDHFSLFAFLMAVSMWLYTKITMQGQDTSAMPGMKFMNTWLMPIMMWFLCNNFSAGLSYYYLLSNIITIFVNWIIRKYAVDENKIWAQLQAASAKPAKKSKFQQRIDEMYKVQQQQQRQQGRR